MGFFDISWKLNDVWDPCKSKDSTTPLISEDEYRYVEGSWLPLWESWNCRGIEDHAWQRKVCIIPPQQFLDDFLPVAPIPAAHLRRLQARDHFSDLDHDNLCFKYCNALNATLKLAKSSIVAKDIELVPQPTKVYRRCPELALYPTHKAARAVYTLPAHADMSDVCVERQDHRALPSWAHMLVPVEVGHNFQFEYSKSRIRMYHYAARVLTYQHRQHLFTLHFQGIEQPRVIIVRWDRSGAVATEPIELNESPHLLYDFIHRLGRLTPVQQGFDDTVRLAPKHEIARLLRYTSTNEHLKRLHADMVSDLEEWPIYSLYCDGLPDGEENDGPVLRSRRKTFLIGKPLNYKDRREERPFGKGVRSYAAYDIANNRLVFLKDSWSREAEEYSETSVYERLQKHNIQHIPTAIAGEDVGFNECQYTVCGDYKNTSALVHHRLVLKEICRPLSTYTCTPELIIAVYHALLAHRDCWNLAGVLHRDISHNNIMIDVSSDEPRGVLIDFDVCIFREDIDKEDYFVKICGTWPFHSTAMLERYICKKPPAPKTVADDLESFVYVLLVMALRFQRHDHSLCGPPHDNDTSRAAANGANHRLAFLTETLFAGAHETLRQQRRAIQQGRPPVRLEPAADGAPPPLAVLLRRLYLGMQEHALALRHAATPRDSGSDYAGLPPLAMLHAARDAAMCARTRTCRRVMDDHEAMLAAFRAVIFDDAGNVKLRRLEESDKAWDQWLGLRGCCGSRFLPPTIQDERWNRKRRAVAPLDRPVRPCLRDM